MMEKKISPHAVKPAEHHRRHLFVVLPDGVTLEDAVKRPELWSQVQGSWGTALRLFDVIDLLSADGSMLWTGCVVVKVGPAEAWLSKPVAMVEVKRPEVSFEDSGLRVVPRGTGYGIERLSRGAWIKQDGEFTSAAAAKQALLTSLPRKVG